MLRMAFLAFKVPFLDHLGDLAHGGSIFWLLLERVDLECVVNCSVGVVV